MTATVSGSLWAGRSGAVSDERCRDAGDASACHSWGEWLAVVDKNYSGAGADGRR